ncbi:MAG: nucleotidyltransferase family protein [Ruminobacter sp.]|jgi:MurNAc alpha-1-phosphate uridylyltransferase|nr:nucleotidyltransferase family protein [Ruminobacter sp.]
MKAMILAAGRGERMRPLTDTTPKPLLKVNDQALIEYHIKKLKAIGITELVVNHAWLGGVIEKTLGDGSSYGVHILYSPEIAGGLETAGGIRHALHLLGTEPFIVVNGDVYTDFDYSQLLNIDLGDALGCLFLTDNPDFHPEGDFGIDGDYLCNGKDYTFSGISVYRPEAFRDMPDERAKLKPYFDSWIRGKQLLARKLNAFWCDVGTPERLADLDKKLRNI